MTDKAVEQSAERPVNLHVPDSRRWNYNIAYHPILLAAVPAGAQRALDIGCGEGLLTRQLRSRVPHVTGIDTNLTCIERAEGANDPAAPIRYVAADAMTYPFEKGSFDVVTSVATLHHLPLGPALQRMTDLLRPGGMLGVVGLAKRSWPEDLPHDCLAIAARLAVGVRGSWDHGAPISWPPPQSFNEIRRIAASHLPDCDMRRRLLGRYTLVWTKPA